MSSWKQSQKSEDVSYSTRGHFRPAVKAEASPHGEDEPDVYKLAFYVTYEFGDRQEAEEFAELVLDELEEASLLHADPL